MAKLTFTNDNGYVSNAFSGGMTLQCLFEGTAKHVIFIDSRLGSDLPWTLIRSIVVAPQSVFTIPEASEGQEFRLRCETEPQSVDIAPISTAKGGGSSTTIDGIDIEENHNGEVDTLAEVIAALRGFPEGKTVKEALEELEATNLTDEDIENIFYGTEDEGDDEPEPEPEPEP